MQRISFHIQCLDAHFNTFLDICPEAYEHDFGFLRPVIPEVVGKFMGCGDFAKGFARVRCDHCDHCAHEYLLPFSVDKMQPNSSGDSIIYRSGMNPKIRRNFDRTHPAPPGIVGGRLTGRCRP